MTEEKKDTLARETAADEQKLQKERKTIDALTDFSNMYDFKKDSNHEYTVSASSTTSARVQPVQLPSSSACSMPASVCCESSSTTRAVPTRTLPSSPTRSTLSVTSGIDEANIPAA